MTSNNIEEYCTFFKQKIQNMTALEKYIWIVRTLYNKGDRGLSLKELNDKWIHDENISNGEPLPRQTFDRWKGNILMILGVNIECRLKGDCTLMPLASNCCFNSFHFGSYKLASCFVKLFIINMFYN